MARIAGVQLPNDKRVQIGLTYVYGIGRPMATRILKELNINLDTKVKDLTEAEEAKIRDAVAKITTEGDLRRKIQMDIGRLQEIGSYIGFRHRRRLPVHGQRTKTNARTKRGKRLTIAGKKKETK